MNRDRCGGVLKGFSNVMIERSRSQVVALLDDGKEKKGERDCVLRFGIQMGVYCTRALVHELMWDVLDPKQATCNFGRVVHVAT